MKKLPCLMILFAVLLGGCSLFGTRMSSIERVENLTGYDLPDDWQEEYYFLGETFTGCASQYSVYAVESEPVLFSKEDTEQTLSVSSIESYMERVEIPAEYRMDFTQEYKFVTGAEQTSIVWFPAEKQVKIAVLGH